MDIWSLYLHLATWAAVNFLCVCSHEVTVRGSDLKLCENDKHVCVTDLRNCGPRPPSSILRSLNMSCYYEMSLASMTCQWSEESNSHTESEVSLIFRSRAHIISCKAILNPVAILNVTARIRNYMLGSEIWSQPHTVYLYAAAKPSQPVLTVLGSTVDSVDVSWRSSGDGSCRLRYRVNHTHTWTQAADFIPTHRDQTLTYRIKDLLPFTVYRAAVACRKKSNIWSDWSSDITTRTQDRVPSRTPEVCYRVEKNDSGQPFFLHLMWKTSSPQDLDLSEVGGHILGYQVSYKPVKKQQLQDHLIQNVTEPTALLVVQAGNCSVTVTAFNMAGYGPAAHLSIDVQTEQSTPPSVSGVWVSSSFPAMKGLRVQWGNSTASPSVPPVSHFAVQWHSETHSSASRWITVDGLNTSTVIQDVDPDESYLISVSPVYNQQCGPPLSLPASLQQGALMEAVRLTVVGVTKTTVTVRWEWQRKSRNIRENINAYRLILRKDSEEQSLSLWSGQWGHTFSNLTPNTEYSLLLLADNVSRNIILVKTDFDEVPAVATVTPLLLLAVTVFIISILSRTVYKSYFFPPISSPRGSTTGQWLMDPNHQKTAERNILDIQDFQVTDVLGEKSFILVGPNSLHSSEEDIHEDTSLLSISHIIKMSSLKLDTEYVSDAPLITEHHLLSLRSFHPDSAVKCHHPDSVFISEKNQAAAAALLQQMQDANIFFPQKKEGSRPIDMSELSHHKETALKPCFREFMANTTSRCAYQMTCEAEYMVSSSFLGKADVETVTGQIDSSYLVCESDYIANSSFTAQTTDKDTTNSFTTTC